MPPHSLAFAAGAIRVFSNFPNNNEGGEGVHFLKKKKISGRGAFIRDFRVNKIKNACEYCDLLEL